VVGAILDEYFQQDGEGMWHQKRVDKEKVRSKKASEKASNAAKARWGKDATGDAPSIATSIVQAYAPAMPSHIHTHTQSHIQLESHSNFTETEQERVGNLSIEEEDDELA
jgi:uncharacterized protein YdaU (DUF1376 family)